MGKATEWLRLLFGGSSKKKSTHDGKEKKGWTLVRSLGDKERRERKVATADSKKGPSYRELDPLCCSSPCNACRNGDPGPVRSVVGDEEEQSKRAIAVAAATAAVAEAAVAAAQAAAAVVRLTSRGAAWGGASGRRREEWAAVKIQSIFRGYLARRALKALKGLVKIQALVRGHIVRKQTAETLRCMHALVRAQARARAGRTPDDPTGNNGSRRHSLGPVHETMSSITKKSTPRVKTIGIIDPRESSGSNWLDNWVEKRYWDSRESLSRNSKVASDESDEKILEIDAGGPHTNPKWRTMHQSTCSTMVSDPNIRSFPTMPGSPSKDSTTVQRSVPSPSSVDMQPPLWSLMFPLGGECIDSPQFYSASSHHRSSRQGLLMPSKSECSQGFLSGYAGYPNYMANTQSSKAKVRSQSAPRQRHEYEKCNSVGRLQGHGAGSGSSSQRSPHLRFSGKAYPGSGRLDRMGMPIGMWGHVARYPTEMN